jgi:hypothetical protein
MVSLASSGRMAEIRNERAPMMPNAMEVGRFRTAPQVVLVGR